MLIKSADDKSKRLALLQDLQQSPMLDGHYKDSTNNVLLNDLRFAVDGEVAQIGHLVIKQQ